MSEKDTILERINCKYGNLVLIKEYSYDKYYLDLHTYNTFKGKDSVFDINGIYMIKIRHKFQHYPISQAIYALECISKYHIYKEKEYKEQFLYHINYFMQKQDNDGGWPVEFDYQYGVKETKELKSPWYSALAQGFIISCLVRAYYLEKDIKYLDAAIKGTLVFDIETKYGGVKSKILDKYICYEEYPTTPNTHILNGFIFSLLGLYDLYKATNNENIEKLLYDGLNTLENCISMYDIGFLTMYDLSNHTIPGNPAKYDYGYHLTHCRQLSALLCLDIVKNMKLYNILDKTLKRWITYADGNMAFFRLNHKDCIIKTDKKVYKVDDTCDIYVDYEKENDMLYAIYILKEDEIIYRTTYEKNKNTKYKFTNKGIYNIKAFYKDKFENCISKLSESIIVNEEVDTLNIENFDIECNIDNNKLSISVKNTKDNQFLEYAYYLIKDKEAINKIWYSKSNKHTFDINENGEYKIQYFIRNIYKETIIENTDSYTYNNIRTINIHGSCISRDAFEFITDEPIRLKEYIARHSIISAVSNSLNFNEEQINLSNFESKFQRRMVLNDLNKMLFERIRNNKSDYMLIELLDERFSILEINNSFITYSNEFVLSNIYKDIGGNIIKKKDISEKLWMPAIDKYVSKILNIYNQDQIIIHEVYFLNKYIDKQGNIKELDEATINKNAIYNDILSKYYTYLKAKIPGASIINITNNYLADENNRWGLAPYHYELSYYKEVLNIINKILSK